MSLATLKREVRRLAEQLRAEAPPPSEREPRTAGDWLECWEEDAPLLVEHGEADFPQALAEFRDAVTKHQARDLTFGRYRNGECLDHPDVGATWMRCAKMCLRYHDGYPPCTTAQWVEARDYFDTHRQRLERAAAAAGVNDIDVGNGRRVAVCNLWWLLHGPSPLAAEAGDTVAAVRRLRELFPDDTAPPTE
jgi:hypothetical protein